jgi:dipeptidyl aminopeptidase/acylaminoacyl peptidase
MTGDLLWSIDLGVEAGFRAPVTWSPDGMYVAVTGARNFVPDGLWVFDKAGQIFLQYVFPNGTSFFSASNLKWSPDSKILAFSRNVDDATSRVQSTLALILISDGTIIDLCTSPGDFIWSPDGAMIALSPSVDAGSQGPTVVIAVPDSHIGHVIDDPLRHVVHGWLSPWMP